MVDKVSTFIGGRVHGLHVVKNVAIRNGISLGARLTNLHRDTMRFSTKTQRNWSVFKGQIRYRVQIIASSTNQEGLKDGPNNEDGSYLGAWKREMEKQKSSPPAPEPVRDDSNISEDPDALERKTKHFEKIQQVPAEERNRAQRIQVIDRAAAAIAAARALIAENPRPRPSSPTLPASAEFSPYPGQGLLMEKENDVAGLKEERKTPSFTSSSPPSEIQSTVTPGPDFWSWSPPSVKVGENMSALTNVQPANTLNSHKNPIADVLEKERSLAALNIPFESTVNDIPFESTVNTETTGTPEVPLVFQNRAVPSLPPLQSLMEVTGVDTSELSTESTIAGKEGISELIFDSNIPQHASEIASVLDQDHDKSKSETSGVNPDGSRWWKETGVELRTNGVICNWTVTRGVNSNGETEWEEKFWEACDDFDYKELGSEKSGRDAAGNVWREFWKEAMWQDIKSGLLHMEKFADKWAKNGQNEQWQEKWWEHYDATGHAEKWADKWCQIDLNTPLEAGHAHVWHERWGEKYDGKGSAMKYTDKWAERAEDTNKWSKWGDKWDEHFDQNSNGIRQGETWWEGASGERWNRTWGEEHDGSGWIHKYGKSSSGEHWDTREEQDTWYERVSHYGFSHCFENSQELRSVRKRTKPKL
ncbi:hypothetical protein KI387_033780 [Taxus chinensis]|uniref:Uncharacterized protein n=1 Tax=Taxus chinensis TaxID=29808 RepID=A0AA38BYP5_TAXCH|nr:hypothetical protein KI387_033780 [Taxus chinensis]